MEQPPKRVGRPKRPADQPAPEPRTRFRVAELAQAQDLNISQLARKSDVAHIGVMHLWYNKIKRVDLIVLERVADALGCSVRDLIADDSSSSSSSPETATGGKPGGEQGDRR